MKKKNYMAPQMRCLQMRKITPFCSSPIPQSMRITSNRRQELLEMEYGGIDANGNLDPD